MQRYDRIYAIHKIFINRRTPISRRDLQERLECSRATVGRTIEELRNYLGAPVRYDRGRNGYYYDDKENESYELPGLWFNASEIHALLTIYHLLSGVQPGLLEPHIAPLLNRLDTILSNKEATSREISKRIRILQMAPRALKIESFRKVADATIGRKRIKMLYHGRERDSNTERWVSPQRLVYYRDNWYLDAWCHLRKGLRSFSIDRLHVIREGGSSKDIADEKLNAHYSDAYGIFAGRAKHKAVIRFSSSAARWVADEHWHTQQETRLLKDGGWEVTVPYSDPRELIMDILKYGADAKVIKPKILRETIKQKLKAATDQYEQGTSK